MQKSRFGWCFPVPGLVRWQGEHPPSSESQINPGNRSKAACIKGWRAGVLALGALLLRWIRAYKAAEQCWNCP
ncbi:hypothetical protein FQZ97_527050 [compost metagenome]